MSIGDKKVLGITLARGGSKGILGKNVRPIAGKPLIAFSVSAAQKVSFLDAYVVSTDSEEIASVVRELGVEVPFMRPKWLAQDNSTSVAALQHAVNEMETMRGFQFDYVVEIMATNPFKTSSDIERAIRLLHETGADSVIGVKKIEDGHPARIKKIVNGKLVDFCVPESLESRRQDLKPDAYLRCGAIYALTRKELMYENRRYGSANSVPLELAFEHSVNIDTEADFLLAEMLLRGFSPNEA